MKHSYNLKFVFSFVAVLIISSSLFSQQVAVTEDGREVYLKSDLENVPVEKRELIINSDEFIVIESKEDLEGLNLHRQESEEVLRADSESADSKASSKQKYDEAINEMELELENKVASGELTEEEMEDIYLKKSEALRMVYNVNPNRSQGASNSRNINTDNRNNSIINNEKTEEKEFIPGSLSKEEKLEMDRKMTQMTQEHELEDNKLNEVQQMVEKMLDEGMSEEEIMRNIDEYLDSK